jgi:hypothetical protein
MALKLPGPQIKSILLVAVFLFCGGVHIFYSFNELLRHEKETKFAYESAKTWVKARAMVYKTSINRSGRNEWGERGELYIKASYGYVVGTVVYTSCAIDFYSGCRGVLATASNRERLKEDGVIDVYVNPRNHQESVIDRGFDADQHKIDLQKTLMSYVFLALVLGVGILIAINLSRKNVSARS